MEEYKEVERKCEELKMYTKRVMDLYCDSKKWKWLGENAENQAEREKYMSISRMLKEMFDREIEEMKTED